MAKEVTTTGSDVGGNGTGNASCAESWEQQVELTRVEFIAPITILIIFNLVVIAGNLLVITAVFSHRKLRTVTNTFIVSLAAADLMLGLMVLPYSSANEVLRMWPFGDVWCSIWLAIDVWLSTSSILNLCAISLDRYLAISRPFKYPTLMSPTRARLLVASVWVVSFVICFPPLIGWNERGKGLGLSAATSSSGDPAGRSNSINVSSSTVVELVPTEGGFVSLERSSNHNTFLVYNTQSVDPRASVADSASNASAAREAAAAAAAATCLNSLGPPSCILTSDPGYIIYSALGSFWIPVWIMAFFYWRIYRTAIRTSAALRSGVLTTKTGHLQANSGDDPVTLRVHRGGSATCRGGSGRGSGGSHLAGGGGGGGGGGGHGGVPNRSPSMDRSSCTRLLPPVSPSSSRGGGGGGGSNNGSNAETSSSGSPRLTPRLDAHHHKHCHSRGANFLQRNNKKQPKIKITFSQFDSSESSFNSRSSGGRGGGGGEGGRGGERQPLRPCGRLSLGRKVVYRPNVVEETSRFQTKSPKQTHVVVQNGSKIETAHEHPRLSIEEDSRSGGFLNKVSRIQIKTHLKRLNKEKKAAKTVGIIVGCFILCWAPFFTVYLLGAFCHDCTPNIVFTVFFWLGYCNSAVNPCIYALCSRDFRYAFKKLIRCRCERKREIRRTDSRFMTLLQSLRIQISSRASDSNSE